MTAQANNASDPNNAASLLPAAHLPQAAAAVSQSASGNPNMMAQLQAIQQQINALMGVAQAQADLPDVVIVNPGGRIVAVSGKSAVEYLAKPGFRKATPAEEERYNTAILRQTQAYLKRLEAKRVRDEQRYLDQLEDDGDLAEADLSALLTAPVTDSQKTGAMDPSEVAKLNGGGQPSTQTPPANTGTEIGTESTDTKPKSRRQRSNESKNDTGTESTDTNTEGNDNKES